MLDSKEKVKLHLTYTGGIEGRSSQEPGTDCHRGCVSDTILPRQFVSCTSFI